MLIGSRIYYQVAMIETFIYLYESYYDLGRFHLAKLNQLSLSKVHATSAMHLSRIQSSPITFFSQQTNKVFADYRPDFVMIISVPSS